MTSSVAVHACMVLEAQFLKRRRFLTDTFSLSFKILEKVLYLQSVKYH